MGQLLYYSHVVYPARVAVPLYQELIMKIYVVSGSNPKAMAFCIMGAGFLARLAYSQYPEYVPPKHW